MGSGRSSQGGGARDNRNWESHPPGGYAVLKEEECDEKMVNQAWEDSVTADEEEAIRSYTGEKGVFREINTALRNGKTGNGILRGKIASLEEALSRGELNQDTILHRVGGAELLGGAKTVSDIRAMYGQIVVDQGFMSSSSYPNHGDIPKLMADRVVAYHIKTPACIGAGAYVNNFSRFDYEKEFLFNKDSAFKILGSYEDSRGLVHVNMEYVGRIEYV